MDYIDLGRRVKDLRRKQNLTQEALAEKLNMSASFLGHIERGTRIASLETLVNCASRWIRSPITCWLPAPVLSLVISPMTCLRILASSWQSCSIRDTEFCNRLTNQSLEAFNFQGFFYPF